jgi:hypothetical protein
MHSQCNKFETYATYVQPATIYSILHARRLVDRLPGQPLKLRHPGRSYVGPGQTTGAHRTTRSALAVLPRFTCLRRAHHVVLEQLPRWNNQSDTAIYF